MVQPRARQRILAYVKRWGPVTASKIGRGLNLSAPTVRYHLAILLADGRVATDSKIVVPKRGRPEKLYRLSDSMMGDNLAALSDVLLDTLAKSRSPDSDRQVGIKPLADGLRERMGAIDAKAPATKRVEQLVEKLNMAHYEARWEAGADGPRILFGRCPYAEIIDRHPELCMVDGLLLGDTLGAEAEQRSKIDRRTGQPDRCVFAMRRTVKGGG
jgi:predicted ArsR family transcriptional regulator